MNWVYFRQQMDYQGEKLKKMEIKIPFTQMTTEELFVTLTGGNGFMAQISLQQIVDEYKEKYGDIADLETMVHKMAEYKD